jgi:hypothetical protein
MAGAARRRYDRRPMPSRIARALAVVLALAPAVAHAHHDGAGGDDRAGRERRTSIGVVVEGGELGDEASGRDFQAMSLVARAALHERFAVGAEAGFARVASPAGDAAGVGDATLRVEGVPLLTDAIALLGGVALDVPSGDGSNGLGAGHFELRPYLRTTVAIDPAFAVHALVAGAFSLARHEERSIYDWPLVKWGGAAHLHDGSRVAPHDGVETALELGGTYRLGPAWLGLASAVSLLPERANVLGPVLVRADLGALVGNLRLTAGIDVPVTDERRFVYRVRLGVAFVL